jgi:hypothetical protein
MLVELKPRKQPHEIPWEWLLLGALEALCRALELALVFKIKTKWLMPIRRLWQGLAGPLIMVG